MSVGDDSTGIEQPVPLREVVPSAPDATFAEGVAGGLTWVPFACYMGLWIVLAGVSAYLLQGASATSPARWMTAYGPLVWAGVALTAFGPVLSLLVWLVARARRPKTARTGLLASAMTRGAFIAFFGVAIWVATLFAVELFVTGGAL